MAPSSQSSHRRDTREDEAVLYHSDTVNSTIHIYILQVDEGLYTVYHNSHVKLKAFHHSTCIHTMHNSTTVCTVMYIGGGIFVHVFPCQDIHRSLCTYARIHQDDEPVLGICVYNVSRSLPHKCVYTMRNYNPTHYQNWHNGLHGCDTRRWQL